MRAVFTDLFMVLFGQIKEGPCGSNLGGTSCTQVTSSGLNNVSLKENLKNIINDIEKGVLDDISNSSDVKGYITKMYTTITGTKNVDNLSKSGMTQFHLNLFFISFMPYLCYLYILYYLPSPKIEETKPKIEETKKTNKAPRNGIVRGLAILATYKFIMYTLYGTYKMSARFNPSSSTTLLLRQSIDLNVMSLFNKQLDYFKDQLDEHIDNTQKTIDKVSSLSSSDKDIEMARSNLINLASNQKGFMGSAKNKAIEKWVFFSFFITHIIALAVIYFFLRNNQTLGHKTFTYFILYSGVWLLVLSIYGVVLVSKNI
jgi:hypothetical protein